MKLDNKSEKVKSGSFQSMNLADELLKGITGMGYRQPTPGRFLKKNVSTTLLLCFLMK